MHVDASARRAETTKSGCIYLNGRKVRISQVECASMRRLGVPVLFRERLFDGAAKRAVEFLVEFRLSLLNRS